MRTLTVTWVVLPLIILVLNPTHTRAETPDEIYHRIHTLRKVAGEYQQAADEAFAFLQGHQLKDIGRQKIYYEYGAALFQQKRFNESKAAFLALTAEYQNTTIDKASEDFLVDDAQFFAAMIEQNHGDKQKAFEGYKSVVVNFPKSNWRPNAIMTLGDLAREKEKWDESLSWYNFLVKEYPNSPLAAKSLFWANRTYIHTDTKGDNSEKIQLNINHLVRYFPNEQVTVATLFDQLNYYLNRYSYKEAEAVARYIIVWFPDSREANRAQVEFAELRVENHKDFDTALSWIEATIQRSLLENDYETYETSVISKAKILIQKGQYDGARKVVSDFLNTEKEDTTLLMEAESLVAYSYYREERYEHACKEFQRILKDYPRAESWAPFLKYYVALCFYECGDLDNAKKMFRKVVDDHPKDGWAKASSDYLQFAIPKMEKNKSTNTGAVKRESLDVSR